VGPVGAPRVAPGEQFGDLLIERELGSGAFATVFLARDTLLDRPVAVKVSRTPPSAASAEERARILREARLVGKLTSPNIVTLYRVHELGSDGWMFEMEYVDGGTLADVLHDQKTLPGVEAVRVLHGVLAALDVAHSNEVVHRDIKPENVLLGRDGTIKLTDFGLGRYLGDLSLSGSDTDGMPGTPLYMAPEVVMGDRPTYASDLWSVGVLAYRLLAGRLPFGADTLPKLFLDIQNAEPAALPEGTPEELAELVTRSLTKRPEGRPGSAREMLAIVDRVLPHAAALRPKVPTLVGLPALVGRGAEIALLEKALDATTAGSSGMVIVTGEAGIGKSTLMRETGSRAEQRGFHWIEAQLTSVGGLLRPLLEGARRVLTPDSVTAHLSGTITPGRFGTAAPLLRGLLLEESPEDLQSRQQTLWAMEQLLRGLARERPVGLLVEDAHLCDVEDAAMLTEIARRLGDARVLLAVVYRTYGQDKEAGSESGLHEMAALPGVVQVDVKALQPDDVYRLLEEHADGDRVAPEVVDRVVQKSDGNPLFAIEFFRHLRDTEATRSERGTVVPGPAWEDAVLPRRFHDLAARRLAGLPEDERALLDSAAVDGLEFDGEALAAVLERSLLSVLRSLQHLYRRHGLVLPRPTGYRFAHALFRDVIYGELAPDFRRETHRRLALHLESCGSDPERLGQHWEHAGEKERAAPHLLAAARRAAARQEQKRAIDLCTRAGIVSEKVDARAHAETLFPLATAFASVDQPERAEQIYRALIDAGDPPLRLRALVGLARVRFFSKGFGDSEEAHLREAIEALPESVELGQAHWLLGVAAKFRGDLDEAERQIHAADAVFTRKGIDSWHSSALDELASLALRHGRVRESESLYGEAARVSANVGRTTNAAISELNQALARFRRGAFEGLDAALDRAIRTLQLEGAASLAAHATVIRGQVQYAEGDSAGALRSVGEGLEALKRAEYMPGLVSARLMEGSLLAARGDLDAAAVSAQACRALADQWASSEGKVLGRAMEAQRLCFAGDVEAAGREAREAIELASGDAQIKLRVDLVFWLAESVLYGLPVDALEGAGELLEDPPEQYADQVQTARAFLSAVRDRTPEARSRAARALRGVSMRRALFAAIADWFDGNDDAALQAARRLGHVWLERAIQGA